MAGEKDSMATKMVALGRDPVRDQGSVNPPVHRTSTIIFPDYATFRDYNAGKKEFRSYGRYGSPTTDGLEEVMKALEGADYAITTGSGLEAINVSLLAFLSAGDHALFPDSIYSSAREFIERELVRFGVEVEFYDPTIGAGIAAHMKPNTTLVYCEAPGSLTFEMQDIPAIAGAARAKCKDVVIVSDNTWATPLHMKPFDLGVDVSIHSLSKYVGGHADVVMGMALCREPHKARLKAMQKHLGSGTTSDDAFLALRGLRTLGVRLKQHEANALEVATWLEKVPEVKRVLFPALAGDPGHSIWKRDMSGSCGLMAAELGQLSDKAVEAMIDGYKHFGLGFSWGGYESLAIVYEPAKIRSITKFDKGSVFLRLHVGLEDPKDLIADLDAGFVRLRAAK